MEEIIVGVVGELQFEVLTYRLENEYNVDVKLEKLHTSTSAGLKIRRRSIRLRFREPLI